MSKRRVVITGLGIISPVGNTVSNAWENIISGKSGIARITRFDASNFTSQIAGEVKDFDIQQYLSAKEARRMDIFIHYGMAAAIQAVKDADIEDVTHLDSERIGVNIGSGIGGLPMIESTDTAYHAGGPRKISPFFIPSTIINMIAGNLSIMYGYKGPNIAIVTACTTATHKDEEWDEIMETNLKSVFRLSRIVLRAMMKARYGRIINISSVVGAIGNMGQTNYAAAKAGLFGFSKSLAREVGSRNITVNCVAPGFIDTDMTRSLASEHQQSLIQHVPLGRLGRPEEVASAVAFLASSNAGYITGTTLHVNGGMYMD